MHHRTSAAQRSRLGATAILVLIGGLLAAACGSATPSPTATSTTLPSRPAPETVAPLPSENPSPSSTAAPPIVEPTVDGAAYADMSVVLEMSTDCGICGPEGWLTELPTFRLYADGLAVYRPLSEEPESGPYRFLQLDDPDFDALIRHAIDESGLVGAEPHYPGNADDAPSYHFRLDARWIDDGAEADVLITPSLGGGTTDTEGNPLEDLPRRERLEAFGEMLVNFQLWVEARGSSGEPFVPDGYTAALVEPFDGEGDGPWPWIDLNPDAFGAAAFGRSLARLTPAQAAVAGATPGGASLGARAVGQGRAATLLVRPLLPGDARPGAFGLRADATAITVEEGIRVRSLPEVSDASIKYDPLLVRGEALFVIDGPVDRSGYRWYQVYAPRPGLTGWVAAGSKTGDEWIAPRPIACTLGASPDDFIDRLGYSLMYLACFSGVRMSGAYVLGPLTDDALRCPDVLEGTHDPAWIDVPLVCSYDFRPEHADTGVADLPAGGILHPSIAGVPDQLLAAAPEGLVVEVFGQLDHPDTRTCTANGDVVPDPALVTLDCRRTFVITDMRPFR